MQYGNETVPWLPSTGALPGDESREIEGGGGRAAEQAEAVGGKAASFLPRLSRNLLVGRGGR